VRNVSVRKMQEVVRQAFGVWKALGIGLTFEEVFQPAGSMLRITFQDGIGSFSYVGTDNLKFQSGQTMNFGWDLTDRYGFTTALHEVGHALGFEVREI
jgi:Astacin (Peptidase family M12A)